MPRGEFRKRIHGPIFPHVRCQSTPIQPTRDNTELPGIYISWPFCAQKCTYCNFASGVQPRELEERYPDVLLREIASRTFPWTPQTVYLGGGTPSSIAPETFRKLLGALPGYPWREATIEAAP